MVGGRSNVVIALDAMGGDFAPKAVLDGASLALSCFHNIEYLIFGDEQVCHPLLAMIPGLQAKSQLIHTPDVITAHEKPSVALRQGKNSSMYQAVQSVKSGKAQAVVSAGNTGALMAIAKLVLRTLPGISRPAIVSVFPTRKGKCVFLDLGANIECDANNLVQFALMGDAFARSILNIKNPSVGLLNVGSEDMKGHGNIKEAASILKDEHYPINFYGYVEGNDIPTGIVDIVVTDGFTGNIALKTAEGTAKICGDYIKQALKSSWIGQLGGLLARPALKKVFKKIDPRLHNGAMFVGLNGIAVKSHGSSDGVGNANAIGVAYELVAHNINQQIIDELAQRHNTNHEKTFLQHNEGTAI